MQKTQAFGEVWQLQTAQQGIGQRVVQRRNVQRRLNNTAQSGLVQTVYGRVNRREAFRQTAALGIADFGMNHLVAVKAVFDFAHGADAFADRRLFLMAGVKVDEAQKKDAAGAVGDLDNQLLARFERYFLMDNLPLDLTRHANRRVLNRHNVRLVLVTQRQVQHQIPRGMEVEFVELLGGNIGDFELFSGFGRHHRQIPLDAPILSENKNAV
ncbi:ATP-dependent DNA helicase RecG domain protein [Neisseria meningitidis NM1476]|nr:ATP-dependent DNA helicase RecG domain protein [Neisseria meningitidis NM1476]CWS89218.1 Uncharacterised protein [Neisseria meningitidis]CWT61291.1 Uncharacterised protein [Neisseria meningitidis]